MGKFYCSLCETSHHDLTNRVQCPTCSRFFCESSIDEMKSIGRNNCPYCDTPISDLKIIKIILTNNTFSPQVQEVDRKHELEETWFSKAKKLKDLKMYEEADSAFNKVLDRDPLNANAWFLKAEVFFELEAYEEAINALNKCLKIDSANFDAWDLKIEILDQEEENELNETCQKFLELLGLALKKTPDDDMLWNRRGKILHILNQNDQAIESFSQAVQLNPKFIEAWTGKAIILREQQNYAEALNCINKSIELDSEYAWNFFQRCLILGGEKRYEEALTDIEKAYQLEPSEETKNYLYSEYKFFLLKRLKGKKDKQVKEFLIEMLKKRGGSPEKHRVKHYLNRKDPYFP